LGTEAFSWAHEPIGRRSGYIVLLVSDVGALGVLGATAVLAGRFMKA